MLDRRGGVPVLNSSAATRECFPFALAVSLESWGWRRGARILGVRSRATSPRPRSRSVRALFVLACFNGGPSRMGCALIPFQQNLASSARRGRGSLPSSRQWVKGNTTQPLEVGLKAAAATKPARRDTDLYCAASSTPDGSQASLCPEVSSLQAGCHIPPSRGGRCGCEESAPLSHP